MVNREGSEKPLRERERLFAAIEELQRRNADEDPDTVEEDAAREVAACRAAKRESPRRRPGE